MYTLGERRILEWVVHRARTSTTVDSVFVTVGDEPENDALVELCTQLEVPHLRGPEEDLVQRHHQVAAESGCDVLCRITADCPFVPPSEITRTVDEHRGGNIRYTTNHTPSMPVGTAVDVIDPDLIGELLDAGYTHPAKQPRKDPRRWGTNRVASEKWVEFSDAHTAVDTPADYWRLVDAVSAVGTDPFAVTQWVAGQS